MAARPDPDRLEAWSRLSEVSRSVSARLDADLRAQCELPLAWFEGLRALQVAGGTLRIREWADVLGVHKSTASRMLDRLVEDGLASREADPADGRGARAVLSRLGRDRLRRASTVHARGVQRHLGRYLSAPEVATLGALLAKLPAGPDQGGYGRSTSTTRASA